ncbi:hypothetical protein A2U01_0029997, partial [Trifolium medium]|nr:hypothetical protein [Trifolium medium]
VFEGIHSIQFIITIASFPVIRSPTSLTLRHWAGVSQETCVLCKQSPGPGHCDLLTLVEIFQFPAENNPQVFLRNLLRIPSLNVNFLRILFF